LECGYKPLEKQGVSSDYVWFNFSMRRGFGIELNGEPEGELEGRIAAANRYSSNSTGY
jgi:hypothetical protein